MRISFILLFGLLTGCAELNELISGKSAYYLSSRPGTTTCSDRLCQQLDAYESGLYSAARDGRIRWVQVVDMFYVRRDQLFPGIGDNSLTSEMRAYQRALAEQMDLKRLTESQWAYLIEKKAGELQAREAMVRNSRPRTNCTTTNTGTANSPIYTTNCY